mmetsp:Transcript_28816/g.79422  ORF Transcript_28816/g.79422 Transcript_28816/m.79422 type:complete len:221 (+) Transcript_28816:188-850(+)
MDGGADSATSHAEPITPAPVAPAPLGDAVLVNHGSFNPPHRGHVAMMLLAKRRLELEGYCVVSGILGITGAAHIRGKGAPALADELRVQCCDLLCAEMGEGWIKGDGRGVRYTSGQRMINGIANEYRGVTFFIVKGADLAERYGVRYGGAPQIFVGRAGCPLLADGPGTFSVAAAEDTGDFSSTKLRRALEARDAAALERLAGKDVAAFLRDLPVHAWRR